MKRILTLLLPCLFLMSSLSSCFVNRTTVGDGPVGKRDAMEVHSKSKQFYLFWGLVRLGKGQPHIPEDKNVQVKSSYNVVDMVLSSITGGLFSLRSVKILVKKDRNADNQSATPIEPTD